MSATKAPVKAVLLWLPLWMLPAVSLLTLTFVVPPLNPFSLPHQIELTGAVAVLAYWIAESGGKPGMPLIVITMTALLVSRSALTWKQRATEAGAVVLVLATVLGGGAFLNEHVVKPLFAVPRPNILELANTPPDTPGYLGMSATDFYALPEKGTPDQETRSERLKKVLTDYPLNERVRQHWISETGYSFPSGHSFSSMLFATFFLGMGRSYFSWRRLWVFCLLPLWAVAVCLSRPVLRVHSPTDICVGALEGIVAGTLAFLLVRWILELLPQGPAGKQDPS